MVVCGNCGHKIERKKTWKNKMNKEELIEHAKDFPDVDLRFFKIKIIGNNSLICHRFYPEKYLTD